MVQFFSLFIFYPIVYIMKISGSDETEYSEV